MIYNVVRGHVKVQINDLEQYENVIETILRKKKVSVEKKEPYYSQN